MTIVCQRPFQAYFETREAALQVARARSSSGTRHVVTNEGSKGIPRFYVMETEQKGWEHTVAVFPEPFIVHRVPTPKVELPETAEPLTVRALAGLLAKLDPDCLIYRAGAPRPEVLTLVEHIPMTAWDEPANGPDEGHVELTFRES